MFPVLRLGVVGAEHDDHGIRLRLQRVLVGRFIPVGEITFPQQGTAAYPEIHHLPLLSEQLLKLGRIGFPPFRTGPLRDAVADTGDLERAIVRGGLEGCHGIRREDGADEETGDEQSDGIHR